MTSYVIFQNLFLMESHPADVEWSHSSGPAENYFDFVNETSPSMLGMKLTKNLSDYIDCVRIKSWTYDKHLLNLFCIQGHPDFELCNGGIGVKGTWIVYCNETETATPGPKVSTSQNPYFLFT